MFIICLLGYVCLFGLYLVLFGCLRLVDFCSCLFICLFFRFKLIFCSCLGLGWYIFGIPRIPTFTTFTFAAQTFSLPTITRRSEAPPKLSEVRGGGGPFWTLVGWLGGKMLLGIGMFFLFFWWLFQKKR